MNPATRSRVFDHAYVFPGLVVQNNRDTIRAQVIERPKSMANGFSWFVVPVEVVDAGNLLSDGRVDLFQV